MDDDRILLESDNVLKDIRNRALRKRNMIVNSDTSTKEDIKKANNILEFVRVEDCFNKAPKSTVFAIFRYLGYQSPDFESAFYNQLYEKVIEEINRVYTFIDEETIKR